MIFHLRLDRASTKAALLAATLLAGAGLGLLAASHFVISALCDNRIGFSRDGTLAALVAAPFRDDRAGISPEALRAALGYWPDSPRLHARLVEAEMVAAQPDLAQAEALIRRAISLAPKDYTLRMNLVSIRSFGEDKAAVEEAVRGALKVVPESPEARFALASLLVEEGKLDEVLAEFRFACAADRRLLPQSLEIVWTASGGDLRAAQSIVPSDPQAQFALAKFLLDRSQAAAAAEVFGRVGLAERVTFPEGSRFLESLIERGHWSLARSLWVRSAGWGEGAPPLVWNGGFEADAAESLAHFDWALGHSDFAWAELDHVARGGARSLRLTLAGRNTTRLGDEVRQLIAVRPGARYRLECYVKTEGLTTPEGPRVAVVSPAPQAWSAASDPITAGSADWRLLSFEFTAPRGVSPDEAGLYLTVKREPRFSYDDPTRGVVWFDDFTLTEVRGGR